MVWIFLAALALAAADPVRICVPESLAEPCGSMARDLPDTFACVVAPDSFGCIKKLEQGEADVTNVDPSGLYLGGKFFNQRPVITELVDGEPFRYQGIALVARDSDIRSASDLRGRSSCHTGLRRTVGWQIPVGKLLQNGIMEPACEEGELASVDNFFSDSCVPGNWSTDPEVDRSLKNKYPSLCSKCKNPSTCAADDPYAGYQGTMRCLAEGAADVAFTKIPELKIYLERNPEFAEQAELLCFNGGRKSVLDEDPCIWGVRPTNAYIAKSENGTDIESIIQAFLDTQTRYAIPQVPTPAWYYKTFLTHPKVSGLRRTEESRKTYITYLGDFIHTIRKPRPGCDGENDVSFCVTSDEEQAKCEDYSKASKSKGLWPNISCLKAVSKAACMQHLKDDHSHLLVLDGGDVYKAGRYFDLVPLAGEVYNGSDATYYSVAVLRSPSDVEKLSDLRGLRSCHTGLGRTAGWVMPVGVLLTEGHISNDDRCNQAQGVANFFSGGSCVPGANDTKYNPGRVASDLLCRHCIGDEEGLHKCARDSKERYSGYAGAFRCLAEGRGDVAFIRHLTVPEYTDGHSDAPWAKNLLSSDFMLLCDGGGTKSVEHYLECNLGKVPSHHVMTGGNVPENSRLHLARLLADSSRYFGEDSSLYRLFRGGDVPDLLFKDSATGLKVVPLGQSYQDVLGKRFLDACIAADPRACE